MVEDKQKPTGANTDLNPVTCSIFEAPTKRNSGTRRQMHEEELLSDP